MSNPAIVWFRRDLRLADNPALAHALENHTEVIPLFIFDEADNGEWAAGAASRWWLHHSLAALSLRLADAGSALLIRQGEALPELHKLIAESGAQAVYWNRLYEPQLIARDAQIKSVLKDDDLTVSSFNSALLFEPWQLETQQKHPYRVFTPFWKAARAKGVEQTCLPAPENLPQVSPKLDSLRLDELGLLPTLDWDSGFYDCWQPGEKGAQQRLQAFLSKDIQRYADGRDLPGQSYTSRLSPHLHFGDISPRQIVAATSAMKLTGDISERDADKFLAEVGWREFGYHLLYHFPNTVDKPLNPKFADFPWRKNYGDDLARWQQGKTGIPIIDAGMRELWATGTMHNRVRMLVASLLTKNLLIPWQEGARWFWDTLVDADLASNTLGWQWVAGSGADAAPYFRIFNPVLQGKKFDTDGAYVRRWVPELAKLPDKHLHAPWEASESVLRAADVQLAKNYPMPIVDLKDSRQEALARFQSIRG